MNIRVSIAMITYNSEKYLKEQIDTIILNMKKNDELVISDDGSTDKTIEIINSYIEKDNRIKLIHNINHGVNGNYINAISNCDGEFIFLSDDDNIWLKEKVDKVLKVFDKNPRCLLVQHDCQIVDSELNIIENSFFEYYRARPGLLKNWIRSTYGGSLIAFRKKLIRFIVPLPKHIPTYYDDWFGIMAAKHGKVVFLKETLSLWRRHNGSCSTGFINQQKNNGIKIFFINNYQRIKIRIIKLGWILFK